MRVRRKRHDPNTPAPAPVPPERAAPPVEPAWTRGLRDRPAAGLFAHDVGVQAASLVSQPGDRDEQEADHIAAQVMQGGRAAMPTSDTNHVQRKAADSAPPTANAPIVQHGLSGSGQALDGSTRATMEQRMGHDFSHVRIHTDERAAESAEALSALAYTTGHHIVFNTDAYAPESHTGRHLLAHELAHVAQQSAAHDTSHPRIQRTPKLQTDLQTTYAITIEKGNKDWSEEDLKDLAWVLGKLSKKEAAILKGYHFLRWTTPEDRLKVDPSYTPPKGAEECGLHEFRTKTNTFNISMYDKCFDKDSTMAEIPIGRFNILHEIGHATEQAALRKSWQTYQAAEAAYNAGVKEYNEADADGQKKLQKKIDKLQKDLDAAEKIYNATKPGAETSTLKQFEKLIAGKKPLTDYSEKNTGEALAEAFAIYKADPKGIEKANPDLYHWFEKGAYLGP